MIEDLQDKKLKQLEAGIWGSVDSQPPDLEDRKLVTDDDKSSAED